MSLKQQFVGGVGVLAEVRLIPVCATNIWQFYLQLIKHFISIQISFVYCYYNLNAGSRTLRQKCIFLTPKRFFVLLLLQTTVLPQFYSVLRLSLNLFTGFCLQRAN